MPTRLELTWINKHHRPRLEPRILLERPEHSHPQSPSSAAGPAPQAKVAAGNAPQASPNLLLHGDNLLALKALEPHYTAKVKCVCIDPPYNTGSAFTHYDDGVEHSVWLSLMRDRLEIMRQLLTDDGSIWVFVDDSEAHYLKVMMDEIFGRGNFVATILWQKNTSLRNDAQYFSESIDFVFCYAKNKSAFSPNGIPRDEESYSAYVNQDNDPRGPWREGDYKCAKSADERPNLYYPIVNPHTGSKVYPRRTRVWAYGEDTTQKNIDDNLLWWGKTGNYTYPKIKKFKSSL